MALTSGRVTLSKRAEGDVGTRAAGDYFGERSLQSTGPAIASATAATACELLRMERYSAAVDCWSYACLLEQLHTHCPVFAFSGVPRREAVHKARRGMLY